MSKQLRPRIWASVLIITPLLWLAVTHLSGGIPLTLWDLFGALLFSGALLALGRRGPWLPALIGVPGAIAAYLTTTSTLAAWAALLGWLALWLWIANRLSRQRRRPLQMLLTGVSGFIAGTGAIAVAQLESRFADEELFVAIEILALAIYWWTIMLAMAGLRTFLDNRHPSFDSPSEKAAEPVSASRSRPFKLWMLQQTRWLPVLLAPLSVWGIMGAYQASFYPPTAPTYPGISAEQPLLCGTVRPATQTYTGEAVFERLLALVAQSPDQGSPTAGMLALGYNDPTWAARFRERLLEEARAARFTEPAGTVKYDQHEAALRVYYYDRIRSAFPDLFNAEDEHGLRSWFAAINRRALIVEPVDWFYGLAFAKPPEGPYENQEIGAGLLSLLEASGLGDPALAARNQAYLARAQRGWTVRSRVTDDTYFYQDEWMLSAYFQSLLSGPPPPEAVRRSADWLLAQLPPDGAPLRYNFPYAWAPAGAAYLAASLTGEPRFIWLAGRAAEGMSSQYGFLLPQPGVERPLALVGEAPQTGSCLIYGDSGLPNQIGPLAPDKIVLRDGWDDDSLYLLLNLRFSGWHRYKATNTISLIYRGVPLIAEQNTEQGPAWLPAGRRVLRDKRIPREQLNGLLIERSGLSAVLADLLGLGGPWAQDPPFYARVVRFTTEAGRDSSVTHIDDWRGWRQRRAIILQHGGPLVIIDTAQGPSSSRAALAWNLVRPGVLQGGRIALGEQAELALLPLEPGDLQITNDAATGEGQLLFRATQPGRLALISVILTGPWIGAGLHLEHDTLRIVAADREIEVQIGENPR